MGWNAGRRIGMGAGGTTACIWRWNGRQKHEIFVEVIVTIFQEFVDPPLLHIRDIKIEDEGEKKDRASSSLVEPVVPSENLPKSLIEWAVLILNTPNPKLKVSTPRTLWTQLHAYPYHLPYHYSLSPIHNTHNLHIYFNHRVGYRSTYLCSDEKNFFF